MAAPPSSIANEIPTTLPEKGSYPYYDPTTAIPSLAGKTFLITGGNTGIGKQTAIYLAAHGPAQIWITARSPTAGTAAVAGIESAVTVQGGKTEVKFVEMDLGSFESVKGAAKAVVQGLGGKGLDVLILNAGMMGGWPGTTKEGFERQFGVNHVGHALLLKLLTPAIEKAEKPRVVSLSSSGHKRALPEGGIKFATVKSEQGELLGVQKYTQSKLANVVYGREFARRNPGILSVVIHPGEVGTELFSKGADGGGAEIEFLAKELAPKIGTSVEEGAKNSVWAATAAEVESGRYYEPVGVAGEGSELSKDLELGKKLWEWTEKELEGHTI